MGALISRLQRETGLDARDILALASRAPSTYKFYQIEKRTGGHRLIAQPARETKALQRIAQDALLHLPVHSAATAYVAGSSILKNAAAHAGMRPILKFDFQNFFPSIRATDWLAYVKSRDLLDEDDARMSSRLFFCHFPGSSVLRLSIGAPTSPWRSNILMYDFDEAISRQVSSDKVIYTRYADDLTFSGRRTGNLVNVSRQLKDLIARTKSPRLRLNEDKTVLATPKYKRFVTGLILANDGRVTVGRDRKRKLRSALHHAFRGDMSAEDMAALAGMVAFIRSVEPAYVEGLEKVYGFDISARLLET